MKVFHVIANARHGGMPQHVLTLSRGLMDRGHEVGVVSMSEGPMIAEFENAGIKVTGVPFLGHEMRRDPLLLQKAVRFTRDLIRDGKPDIVHSHGPRAHMIGGRASRYPGRPPLVSTAHGSYRQFTAGNAGMNSWLVNRLKKIQYVLADRYMGKVADCVIAVCHSTRKDLVDVVKVPREKVTVIYNGVKDMRFGETDRMTVRSGLGLDESQRLVTYVGRVAFHKGTRDLVEAAASICREVPQARILLVGDGPMIGELEKTALGMGLKEKILFEGYRSDALRIVAASDLFVLPSLSEGLALTLLEAAMTSTPMVATDVGGNPEVVRSGKTGMLVPLKSPADLAGAIVELLEDEEKRAEMGRAARQLWQEKFAAPIMVERVEALYGNLLS